MLGSARLRDIRRREPSRRDFPGDDALFAQEAEFCIAEFKSFVGLSYEESVLDFTYYHPSEESWLDGDRVVTCMIYDPGEQVTGSLRGARTVGRQVA